MAVEEVLLLPKPRVKKLGGFEGKGARKRPASSCRDTAFQNLAIEVKSCQIHQSIHHKAKVACGNWQGIGEVSHISSPTGLDKQQRTHHISTFQMHQALYNYQHHFPQLVQICHSLLSPRVNPQYPPSSASHSTGPRGYRVSPAETRTGYYFTNKMGKSRHSQVTSFGYFRV